MIYKNLIIGLATGTLLISGQVSAATTSPLFGGLQLNGEYINAKQPKEFPFAQVVMKTADPSNTNQNPRTFEKAFQVIFDPNGNTNTSDFEYTAQMAYGQSVRSLSSSSTDTSGLSITFSNNKTTTSAGSSNGDNGGYFSNLYAYVYDQLKLYSFLKITQQSLRYKPPGSTSYSVEIAKKSFSTEQYDQHMGILIGSNDSSLSSQAHATNKIPWLQSTDDTQPYIYHYLSLPNVGLLDGTIQNNAYGINFSKIQAPSKIFISLVRISKPDWENYKNRIGESFTGDWSFQRVQTIEIVPENVINLLGNLFVRYTFPKKMFWDIIQADDVNFPVDQYYNCQYMLIITSEYQQANGSKQQHQQSFVLKSNTPPPSFLSLFMRKGGSNIDIDTITNYLK